MKPCSDRPALGVDLLLRARGARITFSSAASCDSRRSTRCSRLSSIAERSGICALTPVAVRLGPPLRRVAVEIEFAAVDVGHLGEALAQRVEADDVGIHLAQAHRHGVHALLQLRS